MNEYTNSGFPQFAPQVTRRLGASTWESTLTILNVDANDLGVFLCSASNRLGCQGEFGRREEGCDKEIILAAESKLKKESRAVKAFRSRHHLVQFKRIFTETKTLRYTNITYHYISLCIHLVL